MWQESTEMASQQNCGKIILNLSVRAFYFWFSEWNAYARSSHFMNKSANSTRIFVFLWMNFNFWYRFKFIHYFFYIQFIISVYNSFSWYRMFVFITLLPKDRLPLWLCNLIIIHSRNIIDFLQWSILPRTGRTWVRSISSDFYFYCCAKHINSRFIVGSQVALWTKWPVHRPFCTNIKWGIREKES